MHSEIQFLDTQHLPQKIHHRDVICLTYYSSYLIWLGLLCAQVRFYTVSPRRINWKVWRRKRTVSVWTTFREHDDSVLLGYDHKSIGNWNYRHFKVNIPRYLERSAPDYLLTQHNTREEINPHLHLWKQETSYRASKNFCALSIKHRLKASSQDIRIKIMASRI